VDGDGRTDVVLRMTGKRPDGSPVAWTQAFLAPPRPCRRRPSRPTWATSLATMDAADARSAAQAATSVPAGGVAHDDACRLLSAASTPTGFRRVASSDARVLLFDEPGMPRGGRGRLRGGRSARTTCADWAAHCAELVWQIPRVRTVRGHRARTLSTRGSSVKVRSSSWSGPGRLPGRMTMPDLAGELSRALPGMRASSGRGRPSHLLARPVATTSPGRAGRAARRASARRNRVAGVDRRGCARRSAGPVSEAWRSLPFGRGQRGVRRDARTRGRPWCRPSSASTDRPLNAEAPLVEVEAGHMGVPFEQALGSAGSLWDTFPRRSPVQHRRWMGPPRAALVSAPARTGR